MDGESPQTSRTKASLRRLAGTDDAVVIERAEHAVEDIAAAAEFVESIGLDRLEIAVAAADDPDLESRGRAALETFERFRRAADGPPPESDRDRVHRGRGTDLRVDAEPPTG